MAYINVGTNMNKNERPLLFFAKACQSVKLTSVLSVYVQKSVRCSHITILNSMNSMPESN